MRSSRSVAAVGHLGDDGHLARQVVRVRVDAERLDGHRQRVRSRSRRSSDSPGGMSIVFEPSRSSTGWMRGRLVREVQADRRLDRLGPPGRLQVHLDDEVGARRPAARRRPRGGASCPAPSPGNGPPGKCAPGASIPSNPGPGSSQVPLAELAGVVQQDPRVMDDLAVARPELDRLDVLPLVDRHRQDEVAEDIVALGRNRERLRHGHDEIGLPQLPAVREPRRRRPLARVALDGARIDPFPERVDIVGRRASARPRNAGTRGRASTAA